MPAVVRYNDGIYSGSTLVGHITVVNAVKTTIEGKLAACLGDSGKAKILIFDKWVFINSGVSSKVTVEGQPLALHNCGTTDGFKVHASTTKTTAN
jgi:hypothetical protein